MFTLFELVASITIILLYISAMILLFKVNGRIDALEQQLTQTNAKVSNLSTKVTHIYHSETTELPKEISESYNKSYGDPSVIQFLDQMYDNKGDK